MLELTQPAARLLEQMLVVPPDLQAVKALLESGACTAEDVSMAATEYISCCCEEQFDLDDRKNCNAQGGKIKQGLISTAMEDLFRLILEYGLDPNAVYDNTNMMQELKYIANGYVAADTLALLLEHGGDPMLMVDGEEIFRDVNFDVIYDAFGMPFRQKYDALVHCWFVLLGYMAERRDYQNNMDVYSLFAYDAVNRKDFDMTELKNHRKFFFGLSHTPSRGEPWTLHIFDRKTLWEVARL